MSYTSYIPYESELLKHIKVYEYEEYPSTYYTILEGPQEYIEEYYKEIILRLFPTNPYFTCVQEKSENRMVIYRSSSCE